MAYLESRGAVFTTQDDGHWWVDLNPCTAIRSHAQADVMSRALLGFRDEIRQLIHERDHGTRH